MKTGEYLLGKKGQGRQRTQTNNSPKIKKFKNYLICNHRNTKCKSDNNQCVNSKPEK